MADVHDKATRSKNMAAIKSKNTKPEMLVRRFLHANGFRYTLHDKKLFGKPDIACLSADRFYQNIERVLKATILKNTFNYLVACLIPYQSS
jgi:DNA mismatch endonuclease Vsr